MRAGLRKQFQKLATVVLMVSLFLSFGEKFYAAENLGSCDLKIISYNLLTDLMTGTDNALELRAARLKAVLNNYMPDSLGFQEARPEWMNWLNANMTDYACVGVGRENGTNDSASGEASPVFYRKDKYNLLDSGTFWLSPTPGAPSKGWDAAYKRVCTWAVLQNKQTGEIYAHVNTHLDHVGTVAQTEGMKLIIGKVKELGARYPVVCTGDFNVNMFSVPYSLMTNCYDEATGLDMADALLCADMVVNRGGTLIDLGSSEEVANLETDGLTAIDHCFFSVNSLNARYYKVMRDTVGGKHVSDHFGIYAELDFGPETGETKPPPSPNIKNTYKAKYGTPVLDGSMDSVYNDAEVVHVDKRTAGISVSDGVASAQVRVLYDNQYLYYFAEIKDATPNVNAKSSKEDGFGIDGFQAFFDFVNNDSSSASSADYTYQSNNGIGLHESGHFICYPDDSLIPYAEYGAASYAGNETKLAYWSVKTAEGYQIEARVALSSTLKQRLAADEQNIRIGAGYQINDDVNDDGYRNCDVYSSPILYGAWGSPVYLEELILSSETAGEPYIAISGTADLDGIMDDAYQSAQAVNVNRSYQNTVVGGQATATVRAIYDDNFLHCFARVTDSTKNSAATRPSNNYGIDGMQFFIDFAGENTYIADESGYLILDLVATDGKLVDGSNIQRGQRGFWNFVKGTQYDYAAISTDTGYNLELKVALSGPLKTKMAQQQNIPIRVGFQVNDDTNDDGTRDAVCFSKDSVNGAWSSNGPAMLSTMILTARDETLYSITVNPEITGGTVTADKSAAQTGERVILTIAADEGKKLKPNSLRFDRTEILGNSFIMPGRDVIVTAEFEDVPIDYSAYMAVRGTPAIDGVMDALYNGAQPIVVDKDSTGTVVSGQATAVIKTLYDEGYLYCFAQVKDSTLNSANTRPVIDNYGIDGLQFFFDFAKAKSTYTTGESGYVIVDFAAADGKKADGSSIQRGQQGFYSYTSDMYSYKAVKTGQGYDLELKFPLSGTLKQRIAANEGNLQIGVGFQVNDDTNNDGKREKLCFSHKEISGAWNSNGPTMLANMYLITD